MHTKTHKFFNSPTRQAMFEKVKGYVDKSVDMEAEIERVRALYDLDRIYRFDLGENSEGYSPRIREYLDELRLDDQRVARFNEYPDSNHAVLKQRLAEKYAIPPEWFIIAAGLDSILDLITRVFLDHRDVYLMPTPSFFLFEALSERMGAVPYFLELREEDQFRWTNQTTHRFKELVDKFRPKLIWIANPNNPTGHLIHDMVIEELLDYASSYNAFVVVDEAFGEYTDPPGEVLSAARFLPKYQNLMVLRTFSKKYGLASLRIGYLMCSSPDILEGIQIHRHPFPVTQLSADLALIALEDEAFLTQSRTENISKRKEVFAHLTSLSNFSAIPSSTNIFMVRHHHLGGEELKRAFEQRGIIASHIDISGIKGRGYLRFSLRNREDNQYLCDVFKDIDRGWRAPIYNLGTTGT
ncbi:MAG: histidinol-phosphate aminotransferase family protein [Acidobacteria bacterium]|nr:histidinol-phosphate aminotransferase family protein [Acidobacteriota bacterium]